MYTVYEGKHAGSGATYWGIHNARHNPLMADGNALAFDNQTTANYVVFYLNRAHDAGRDAMREEFRELLGVES